MSKKGNSKSLYVSNIFRSRLKTQVDSHRWADPGDFNIQLFSRANWKSRGSFAQAGENAPISSQE